jgi:hypothetical protein
MNLGIIAWINEVHKPMTYPSGVQLFAGSEGVTIAYAYVIQLVYGLRA